MPKERMGIVPAKVRTPSPEEREKLRTMQFAEDEFGNRKMSVDADYKREVEKFGERIYGGADDIWIIGFD
ncbi:hypothetical protein MIB92_11835 [Aestuariirhabdus sp. Z084]|uniref:hypothetical protein n=1 Tax=Aestuariirhabdus haliotis TaxID=2918751 RepID=UPI00201B3BCE|nr:hypothetical protein [Aestuariirhabdus haliotis]MCL6416342.1 hypothetical protein [Aestuariirhabdus haliotis]MCL6420331.1 hypothetical protein [Aestuariirhabdus haliotis]